MANVTLITHTPFPEKTVACAAKLCYSPSSIDTVMDNLTDEKTAAFVDMLSEIGHESPIEHANFTFGIEGVSRAFLAQITRHRLASYSVQSQRYVKEAAFEFVTPPAVAQNAQAHEAFLKAMADAQQNYTVIADLLKEGYVAQNIQKGMSQKDAVRAAEKKAIEDARFVLPNACDTKMVVTMNARSLLNFFRHRCCNRAQWEIHDVADQMLALCLQVAPHLFAGAGPSCVGGKCPEGNMSCNEMVQIRKKYQDMKLSAK